MPEIGRRVPDNAGAGRVESDFNLLRWLVYRPSMEEALAIGVLAGPALGVLVVDGPLNVDTLPAYTMIFYLTMFGASVARWGTILKDFHSGQHRDFPGYGRLHFAHHYGKQVILKDGTRIRPGDWIGYMSTNDNVGPKNEVGLLEDYSPSLVAEVMLIDWLGGMVELAKEIEVGGLEPRIKAITAQTHFAGTATAKSLGFEIHNADLLKYLESYFIARDVARNINDTSRRSVRQIWRRVKRPWMSVEKLLAQKEFFEEKMQVHQVRVTRLLDNPGLEEWRVPEERISEEVNSYE